METFDPHQVLGLARPASAAQIRQAFRRLAMRWHPDRNASPDAAERFRQIRAAHDALLLEDEEAGDAAGASRGPVEEGELWVSLEEAIRGVRKSFVVARESPCGECDGSGEVELRYSRLCAPCHGTGKVRRKSGLERCDLCSGKGYRLKTECEACGGQGKLRAERELSVAVPALCIDGRVLRLAGQGPGPEEEPGDLLLVVRYREHKLFQRDGDALRLTMPVSVFAWLAGETLMVLVPGAEVELALAPGGGERSRILAGQGLPLADGRRGDLVVDLEPLFPEGLTPAAIKLLRQLDRQLGTDETAHFPELAAWRRRVLEAGQA